MNKDFTEKARRAILGDYFGIVRSIDALSASYDEGAPGCASVEKLMALIEEKDRAADLLREKYLEGLPEKNVSRCPFTGRILTRRMDHYGIDGLWWDCAHPARPGETLLPTFFCMDGALTLQGGRAENAPFLCRPGPDIPFVLPRLLEYIQVRAVVSRIKIGPHTAYPIVYYADPMLDEEIPVSDWGAERYWGEETAAPRLLAAERYNSPDPGEYDFELEPWIRAGKLLWIAPGDKSLTLHGHLSHCPYLDLPGSIWPKYIKDGEVWEDGDEYGIWDAGYPWAADQGARQTMEEIEEGEV